MIQQQSRLKVSDNSGAKKVTCIKTLGGFKRKTSNLGDIIVISVQQLRNRSRLRSKVKKGEVLKAFILRSKRKSQRPDGSFFYFMENSVCLLNKQGKALATRIIGPVPKTFKNRKYNKFASISAGLV